MNFSNKWVLMLIILSTLACGGLTGQQAEGTPASSAAETTSADGREVAATAQWATGAQASSFFSNEQSPASVVGPPEENWNFCASSGDVWSPAGTESEEYIDVYYDTPVYAEEINIVQGFAPDTIASIELLDVDGNANQIYRGTPSITGAACPYTLTVTIPPTDYLAQGARIVVASVDGEWTLIDAVQLVGRPE